MAIDNLGHKPTIEPKTANEKVAQQHAPESKPASNSPKASALSKGDSKPPQAKQSHKMEPTNAPFTPSQASPEYTEWFEKYYPQLLAGNGDVLTEAKDAAMKLKGSERDAVLGMLAPFEQMFNVMPGMIDGVQKTGDL